MIDRAIPSSRPIQAMGTAQEPELMLSALGAVSGPHTHEPRWTAESSRICAVSSMA